MPLGVEQEQDSECLAVDRELSFPKSVSFYGPLNHGVAMRKLLVLWCWSALVFLAGRCFVSVIEFLPYNVNSDSF